VLVEAHERATISGGRFLYIANGIVRHQDRDEHRPLRIANRTPRIVCHAGFPTDDRLMYALTTIRMYLGAFPASRLM
jgi:hypothetical protein